MSLGNRILKRGKAALPVSTPFFTQPRKPLLFLYPQWTRTATTAQERLPVEHEAHISPQLSTQSYPEGSSQSVPKPLACRDDATNEIRQGLPIVGSQAGSFSGVEEKGTKLRKVQVERRSARKLYNSKVREGFREWRRQERGGTLPDWRNILHALETHTIKQSATWHDDALKLLVPVDAAGKLFFGLDGSIWDIKARCGCHIKLINEDGDNHHRAVLLSGPVTSIAKAAAEILQIAPGSISDEQFWLRHPQGFNTQSPYARENRSASKSSSVIPRIVRSTDRGRITKPLRADQVPRPSSWTSASFAAYVEHLTSIRMSSRIHRIHYKTGENHIEIVVNILRDLFLDPKCRGVLCVSTFNDAIAYLVRHNNIKLVRELCMEMETIGLRASTATYNIMLRGAAKSEDLHAFQLILRLMLSRGCYPDANTWVAFLMALNDFKIKLYVLAGMKSKNLLHNPQIQHSVCEHLVGHEIQTALDSHLPHHEFLKYMASRYGEDWLTLSTANRILDALGSRGLISQCWDFIQYMHRQSLQPNRVSINTILYHCEKQVDVGGSLQMINRLSSLNAFKPDERIYQTLFSMACNKRLYATARVVWRYACLDGATTFSMRKRVSDSVRLVLFSTALLSAQLRIRTGTETEIKTGTEIDMTTATPAMASTKAKKPSRLWHIAAGPFILDFPSSSANLQQPHLLFAVNDQLQPHISPPFPPTLISERTISGSSDRKSRARTVETLVTEVVKRDLEIFRTWTPRERFAHMLMKAFEADEEMKVQGDARGGRYRFEKRALDQELEDLAKRMPRIPLIRRYGEEKLADW